MKRFAELYRELDETTRTSAKVDALASYLAGVAPADAAWAVSFLIGRRPKRLVKVRSMAGWATEAAGLPAWMFEECYDAVGDLAETITLLIEPATAPDERPLRYWVEERLLPLRGEAEEVQRREILRAWREMDGPQIYVWNKLITGAFRVGVSQRLVVRALARASDGVDEATIAHRLMGPWEPSARFYEQLMAADTTDADVGRPYPFFLAYPLEVEPSSLGRVADWQLEWKWDGIRAQLIRRDSATFLWSRGEELITDRFPEIAEAAALLPDGTVLDGELLPWSAGRPLPFAQLQRRIGRRTLGPKILAEVPAVLLCYDLLEWEGADVRGWPLERRRAQLESLLGRVRSAGRLRLSAPVPVGDWEEAARARDSARERGAEGLMVKRLASAYGVGRRTGAWWKWKVDPFTVDAVLIYAQRGSGRRASLYTDYTFAVRDGDQLVPFAKAYTGLTDAEIRRVDAFVRRNTVEKFGPVRSVKPELVFEIAFEGIQGSPRHRSGIAVRFPRISRWRADKRPEDATSLDELRALLAAEGAR